MRLWYCSNQTITVDTVYLQICMFSHNVKKKTEYKVSI